MTIAKDHTQAVNQKLGYKTSERNTQKVSHSNFSPHYLHDDRHLKRNISCEMISGVELLFSNIYRAVIGKAPGPGTLKKSLPQLAQDNFKPS